MVPHQNKPENSHKQNNPIFGLTYEQEKKKRVNELTLTTSLPFGATTQ